jgi:hypothetical protein
MSLPNDKMKESKTRANNYLCGVFLNFFLQALKVYSITATVVTFHDASIKL